MTERENACEALNLFFGIEREPGVSKLQIGGALKKFGDTHPLLTYTITSIYTIYV